MKQAFHVAHLIRKYQDDSMTGEERVALESWLNENNENQRAFNKMISDDFYQNMKEQNSRYDHKIAYSRFVIHKKEMNKQKRLRRTWLKVAAVIIPISIAFAVYFLSESPSKQEIYIAQSFITSGGTKATLTLETGEVIELDKSFNSNITTPSGTQIQANGTGLEYEQTVTNEELIYNKLDIPRGGEFFIILSDGTRVWVNSETNIRYPIAFSNTERRVFVEGEAYFEVVKDSERPFIVEANKSSIEVLGTSFNVHAYSDEHYTTTTLVEGSVRVNSSTSEIILNPGYQAVVNTDNGSIFEKEVEVTNYTSWKDGRFIFTKQRMEDIMKTLERWYNIEVIFEDENAKNYSLTGDLVRYGDFLQVTNKLQKTGDLSIRTEGNRVYIKSE